MKTFMEKIKALCKKWSDESTWRIRKWIFFGILVATVALSFGLLFADFFRYHYPTDTLLEETFGLSAIQAPSLLADPVLLEDGGAIVALILLIVCGIVFLITATALVIGLYACISDKEKKLLSCVKVSLIATTIITVGFTIGSWLAVPIINAAGGMVLKADNAVPMILALVLDVLCAICIGVLRLGAEDRAVKTDKEKRSVRLLTGARLELVLYAVAITALTIFAMLSNLITVNLLSASGNANEIVHITGIDLFKNRANIRESGQIVVYCIFAMLVILSALSFLSILAYFSKSKLFYKIALLNVVVGASFCLLVGLFGKYYEIVQGLNKDVLASMLEGYGYNDTILDTFDYSVSSHAIYFFLGTLVFVGFMLVRRPYSKGLATEAVLEKSLYPDKIQTDVSIQDVSKKAALGMGGNGGGNSHDESVLRQVYYADPCPAFTELDEKMPSFQTELDARKTALFENPTLPALVQFVVQYARDSRLHLSYTEEDIATFVAGLGTTKLSILQGMSGTGKTSLPKIFAEALYSVCDLVEVESSWRDKNELLGYYNEFSKVYTPKKFTQALYRAKLNPEVLTFIVLDEMNLSRIEYYFSDFLSLMENEPDKRELKLLNVGLYRVEEGEKYAYAGLTDGHTLKIPSNVWFIGTANRDESTFEISDKVYDRAHTMNFNKRAKKVLYHNEPIAQRYLPVQTLETLFENAKATVRFNVDSYPAIAQAEKLLAPYNISFGNRIAMQMESFVNVYCSCFAFNESIVHTAVEKILLSKVVSKLELKSVADKDALADEFESIGFAECATFIRKLNED